MAIFDDANKTITLTKEELNNYTWDNFFGAFDSFSYMPTFSVNGTNYVSVSGQQSSVNGYYVRYFNTNGYYIVFSNHYGDYSDAEGLSITLTDNKWYDTNNESNDGYIDTVVYIKFNPAVYDDAKSSIELDIQANSGDVPDSRPTNRYLALEADDADALQEILDDEEYAYYDVVSTVYDGSKIVVILKKTRWNS